MTIRHRIVVRLSQLAVFGTLLFGTGSAIYLLKINEFSLILETNKNIGVLRGALLIDQLEIIAPLNEAVRVCDLSNKKTCSELLSLLLQATNQARTYKKVMVNTLGYHDNSPVVRQITDDAKQIDHLPKQLFGKSFSEVSTDNGIMVDSYLDTVKTIATTGDNSKPQYFLIKKKLSTLFTNLNISLNENTAFKSGSAIAAKQEVFMWLLFIIVAEIAIFLLVSIADLLINNSNPEVGFEFTWYKIQPKVIPLAASVFLGFITMILSELLLFRQTTDIAIGNCREHNQALISLLDRVDNPYFTSQRLLEVTNVVQLPRYCTYYKSNVLGLSSHYKVSSADNMEKSKQIILANLLNDADSYHDLQKQSSSENARITIAMLIFNVLTLLALAVFLRLDSEEIG